MTRIICFETSNYFSNVDMLTSEDIFALLIVCKALYLHIKNISVSGLYNAIKTFASIFLGAEKFASKADTKFLRPECPCTRFMEQWQLTD